ncbi:hypothetical protein NG799_23955 [Laspinema sp. D1]|uniref:Uncharacterized protein n=1 Tax=Laspinema palackyanum D2a TaxID=2953684 RepID=A0ABT2MZE4_9CYAN|nr:hypothetical protein [Laspinema sp. D2a]
MITPLTRVTLKAFLAAVCSLEESLPDAVQVEIRTVGQTGEYGRLDVIARNCPQLKTAYREARQALNHPSQERNKGKDFRPDETPDPFNTETENFARNFAPLETTERLNTERENHSRDTKKLKDIQALLDKIEAEMTRNNANGSEVPEKIEQILTAEDCFAIASQLFP